MIYLSSLEEYDYWNEGLWHDLKAVIKNSWIHKKKLIVDITIKPASLPGEPKYVRNEKWTDEDKTVLCNKGYREMIGLHDNLAWSGVKIYGRINNGEKFDIHEKDEYGRFLYSQDTSATLNDSMVSSATRDFIKGMGKTALPTMDTQKIIFIALIGAGALIGLKILGVF